MAKLSCLMLLAGLQIMLTQYAVADSCNSLDELNWLLGDWISESSEKRVIERWHRVSQTTFEGLGEVRSRQDKRRLSEESLRLVEMSGAVFYLAKVAHNEHPVPFKLLSCSNNIAVFENVNHDFPQRLVYKQKTTNKMVVDVTGKDDKGFQISFVRENGD